MLEAAARVAGYDGPVEPMDSQWLHEQGVEDWMGPRSLPLWIADPEWAGFGARDGSAARAAGLTLPLAGRARGRGAALGA